MLNTKFYANFTYYKVLNMSNNIKKFSYYKTDLQCILKEAIQAKNKLKATESRLKSTFSDFLLDVVLRKLSTNLTANDLPLQ